MIIHEVAAVAVFTVQTGGDDAQTLRPCCVLHRKILNLLKSQMRHQLRHQKPDRLSGKGVVNGEPQSAPLTDRGA